MSQRTVDTHVHVWNFEKAEYGWLRGNTSLLARSYHLAELEEERTTARITDGVLVQAANNFDDTDWMLEVAAANDWIKGVVGWLPLTQPNETEKALQHYTKNSFFKGVRHLIHDESDPRWLLQESVIESLKILANYHLPYDVVGVRSEHLETAMAVAEKVPSLRMVFDHLNQPPIRSGEHFGRWGELMKEAAEHPAFFAKISGLGTTAGEKNWSASDIRPYIEFALEQFGVDRCFCGGDWPVSLLADSYSNTWKIYREVIDALLNAEESDKIYFKNAAAFYGL